jgi:RNA polymerase sigma factor (sigma-70 family)
MQPAINNLTDEELFQRAALGDWRAFGILYERYLDSIYPYMFYRVANELDAEDLAEIVFLKIWERIPQLRGEASVRNFRAWLYRISHNLVVDYYRTRRPPVPLTGHENRAADEGSIDDPLEYQKEGDRLAAAVSRLPTLSRGHRCSLYQSTQSCRDSRNYREIRSTCPVLQYRALKKSSTIWQAKKMAEKQEDLLAEVLELGSSTPDRLERKWAKLRDHANEIQALSQLARELGPPGPSIDHIP